MTPNSTDLRTLLQRLRCGVLSAREVVNALDAFGERGFTEAEADVSPFLASLDGELRRYALATLVRDWKLPKYQSAAEQMLLNDPDEYVRMAAATALGSFGRYRADRSVLRALYHALTDHDENPSVRLLAYEAILDVLGRPMTRPRPRKFSEIRDWEPIENLRSELDSADK